MLNIAIILAYYSTETLASSSQRKLTSPVGRCSVTL